MYMCGAVLLNILSTQILKSVDLRRPAVTPHAPTSACISQIAYLKLPLVSVRVSFDLTVV